MTSSKKVNLHASSTNLEAPKFSMAGKHDSDRLKASELPGPGKYGVPSVKQKYKTIPSYGFGSSIREANKSWKGQPGPGSYNPRDPNLVAPHFGFGSAARIPKPKDAGVPPPGTYAVATKLFSREMTFAGKREGKKSAGMPGPGQYSELKRGFLATVDKDPDWSFGTGKRPEFWKTEATPDPGAYKLPKCFGDSLPTMKSVPNIALASRRKPQRADSTPGPYFPHYSQF